MMKPFPLARLLKLTIICLAWPLFATEIGAVHHELKLQSELIKNTVHLNVYVPHNYAAQRKEPYSVLYTTAGDSRFEVLKAQIDWLSHTSFSPLPQLVIVRIPTLSFAGAQALSDQQYYALLAKVLRQEIEPLLNSRFNLSPFKILEGYSSRGNLALGVLQHAAGYFNAAVMLAPALELQQSEELAALNHLVKTHTLVNYLYLSLGNFAANRPPFDQLKSVATQDKQAKSEYHFDDLSAEHYHSNAIIGLERGLRRLFADLKVTDFSSFASSGVPGLSSYHEKLIHKYGYPIDMGDNLLGLGQYFFEQQMQHKGHQAFEALLTAYPQQLIYHLRYGQAMLAAGLTLQAKVQLEQTLQLAVSLGDEEAQHYIGQLLSQR